jgi:hypothetical protein
VNMDDIEKLLLNAERPKPREDMRTRVLVAALPLVESQSSRLDRMWFSLKWRMLATLAVVVLAAIDVVSSRSNVWAPTEQNRIVGDNVRVVEMAAREAGLTPADTRALVAQALAASRPPRLASLNLDTLFPKE